MQYIGLLLYWLIIIAAVVCGLKGLVVLCSKRAIYPVDIFKEIEVLHIRQYNLLNGLLLLGISAWFAAAAYLFQHGSTYSLLFVIITSIVTGIAFPNLEKKIEKKYLIHK